MAKENSGSWTTVIRPRRRWLDLRLGELVHYRDLILLLVKRDFTVMYKQTILGPAWAIIQPLLTTIIFTVVFGNIAELPTDSMPAFVTSLPAVPRSASSTKAARTIWNGRTTTSAHEAPSQPPPRGRR